MEMDSLFDLLSERLSQMDIEKIYEEGIWDYYLTDSNYDLPNYGFKIHVSATVENVLDIAEIIFPISIDNNVRFKFIKSITHLGFLNMGNYGYSQIGKMCTIYPETIDDLLYLLEVFYKRTKRFASVAIPSDFPYMCSSVVYYRYGELKSEKEDDSTGFVDFRKKVMPYNIDIPIMDYYIQRLENISEKYIPLKCIRARGKSSVYLAIDAIKKNICIIKKGNFLGEINLDGEDGLDKVYNEYIVLEKLEELKIFPKVYDAFYKDNSLFIVEEFIEGDSLTDILLDKDGQKINSELLLIILEYIKSIHSKGYIINDLSPDNIIVCKNKCIRFIDAEESITEEKYTDIMNFVGTPGFFKSKYSYRDKDLYSFICICYFLFNRTDYIKLREETKKDFIEKIDKNPCFLENITIDVADLLYMKEDDFFVNSYETKINMLENIIQNIDDR